jgi:hypothetical protein
MAAMAGVRRHETRRHNTHRLAAIVAVALQALLLLPSCTPLPTLRVGARGGSVTLLQQRLADLRYDIGAVDGVFGDSTLHAVVAFQKVNGLPRDGIVGATTWSALERPRIPAPRYAPTANGHSVTGLEVDLSRQVVYLTYLGVVGRTFDTSTGNGDRGYPYTYTPRGSYRIYRLNTTSWEYGPLGALYKPAYFTGGYAVHGADSVPPYPASHGCVRLTLASRDRLAQWLWLGMPVYVY